MTKQDFMKAEMLGRLKVIYGCQMQEPDSIVISMPLEHPYDLQWRHSDRTRDYIEVKNRKCSSSAYPDIMFNVEKVESNEKYGEHFYYVATYTDDKALWFQPTEMPDSGVTYRDEWIKKTNIDPDSPRVLQKRMYFNTNDISKITNIPIQINDKQPNS